MKKLWLIAATTGAAALMLGCATAPSELAVKGEQSQTWPVITEPNLEGGSLGAYAQIRQIQFAAGEVSLGSGAEYREPLQQIAVDIRATLRSGMKTPVKITGYATDEKGHQRAEATARYRAQSVYYKLARAGVPKAQMQYQTEVVSAKLGAQGRQVQVAW